MKTIKKLTGPMIYLIITIIISGTLLIGGCQKPAPVPAAAVDITIGIISDLTGPTASGAIGDNWGIEDALKGANEANEVPGVNFTTTFYDNRFDVGRSLTGYEMMKTQGVQAVWLQITGSVYALKPKLAEDKIIGLVPGPPKGLYPPGWVFSAEASYSDGAGAAFDWILEDWKKEGRSGKPKIAWLTWDADYGHSGLIVNWYATEIGLDVLKTEFYPSPAPQDTSSQLLRLKEAGANYVLSVGPQSAWQVVLKDAQRLGLKDTMKFIAVANAMESDDLIDLAKEAAEGMYFVHFFSSLYEENVPGVKAFKEMQVKYRGKSKNWMRNEVGCMTVKIFVEAVKQAVTKDKISPDKINGQVIYNSLEKNIKNMDTGGLTGPLTITPEKHYAADYVKVFQIQGGKQLPITDWREAPHLSRFEDVKR
ncbi:MAG: ABC transporter substrate-binding protein [Dehalococcoidia bacterium]|nr:ABC transporter substrate-binding protein [Dehalococcoidia bacterium]